MDLRYGHIAGHLFDTPLMFDQRKAETILHALGSRITGQAIVIENGQGSTDHIAFANGRPSAGIVGDRLGRAFDQRKLAPFDVVDGVAIIPIEGTLVHKGGWIGASSGETSYQGLQVQVTRAAQRKDVKGVVFEVDSFGGQVSGAFETAAMIRELSKAKPTIAILTDFAYSAGYLLASQARQVIAPRFGGAGAIGVITLHADYSRALEQDGISVTILASGAHKADGNPYEPLDPDLQESILGQLDAMRDEFADAVARGRGKRLTKAKALKTEAQSFRADEALELGLVDAISDPHTAFAAVLSEIKRTS